jgi:protocatechuate 3,4-dioxygenase beta subunit
MTGIRDGRLDRRTALRLLGAAGFGAAVVACGGGSGSKQSSGSRTTSRSSSATSSTAGSGAQTCVLSRELTEGPYYLDLDLVRADITEDRPGAPLALALTVVDATACTPIRDAVVDIWHTDASDEHSGVEGNGGTFLRGTQVTGTDGVVTFATIYPGWYSGRAVHIHVKVHVSGTEVHTGQLFFPDDFTSDVYRRSPYASRPGPDLVNRQDQIFSDGGAQSVLAPTASGDGYAAGMTLGVMTS